MVFALMLPAYDSDLAAKAANSLGTMRLIRRGLAAEQGAGGMREPGRGVYNKLCARRMSEILRQGKKECM